MPTYEIEARGTAREYYEVEAEDEDAAREAFERGDAGPAYYVEVEGIELVKITKQS